MNVPFVDLKAQHRFMKRDIDHAIESTIESGRFVLGEAVARFEQNFAEYCGAKYCVGVASGTDALKLSLVANGIGEGDEVITVSNTATPTVMAIVQTGARPVFVDIGTDYNIDVKEIEKHITGRTKAILPVHLYGKPCRMPDIAEIALQYNLCVIEDACQAHGAKYSGERVGSCKWSSASAFSFYPTKNLGCMGDGGAITTNDPRVYEKLMMLRNYGIKDQYHSLIYGFNSRLDEIQAAILDAKLKHLNLWNDRRRMHAKIYDDILDEKIVPIDDDGGHVYHLYVVRDGNRDELKIKLVDAGVATVIHYPFPVHKQIAFSEYSSVRLEHTESYAKRILSLPIYPEMTDEQVKYVAERVNKIAEPL